MIGVVVMNVCFDKVQVIKFVQMFDDGFVWVFVLFYILGDGDMIFVFVIGFWFGLLDF